MPELDFISIFVARLNRTGIRYMLTGSVACIIYGQPRMTNDVDLVLEVRSRSVEKIAEAFPLDAFYCPPLENLMIEAAAPWGHFNLVHHKTGLPRMSIRWGRTLSIIGRWKIGSRSRYGGTCLAGAAGICDPSQAGILPRRWVR